MSRTTDRFRPPYSKRLIESPRQCVFARTVNHSSYLRAIAQACLASQLTAVLSGNREDSIIHRQLLHEGEAIVIPFGPRNEDKVVLAV
jgi:hypothetical protein